MKKNEFSYVAHTCGPRYAGRAHECAVAHGVVHARLAYSARRPATREIPRALTILQKRPRTSPELQLYTNTIFPSLKPFHLSPRLS